MTDYERLPTFSQLRGFTFEKGTDLDPQPLAYIRYADDRGQCYELPIWSNCALELYYGLSVLAPSSTTKG